MAGRALCDHTTYFIETEILLFCSENCEDCTVGSNSAENAGHLADYLHEDLGKQVMGWDKEWIKNRGADQVLREVLLKMNPTGTFHIYEKKIVYRRISRLIIFMK